MNIALADQNLELRPSGAIKIGDNLIVADLHLGKERAFRQQGVPVPDGPSQQTLNKLTAEAKATKAMRIIFLGDLFHHQNAIAGTTFESLQCWLQRHPGLEPILVKGNHDRIPPQLENAIETVQSFEIGGLSLYHHPQDPNQPHLAGHIHPAIRIATERLRCFWLHQNRLILPSFAEFTGCATVTPEPNDQLFIAVGNTVRKLCC